MTSARVLVPVGIAPAMIKSGSIEEPSGGSFNVWSGVEGDYYTVDTIRARTGMNRLYKCLVSHTLDANPPMPENDPTRWEDQGEYAGQLEVPWISSGPFNYYVGDLFIRTSTHRTYECVVAHAAGSGVPPELDPTRWLDVGPTNRWKAFDPYSVTPTVADSTLTYVIQPGAFVTGISIWKPQGDTYSIVVKDAPGGAVIASKTGDLYEQAAGFYEYLYQPWRQVQKVGIDNIPLALDPEITVTITAASGTRAAIGTLLIGDWRVFIGAGEWGGTEYGASSSRQSYSYLEYNADGTIKREVKRASRRDVRASVIVPAEEAMYADALIEEVMNIAVEFEATEMPRYGYLNLIGRLTADMTAENNIMTKINITMKGSI